AFTADERAKRSTPVLWVYHYWDTAGDVTPIGRDDIRAAAERLAAAFEESGTTNSPSATPQATARAMELQAR
ncbi:MAG: hypothetical protein ACKVS9_08215, partial [Phycisphaerae bacterium]